VAAGDGVQGGGRLARSKNGAGGWGRRDGARWDGDRRHANVTGPVGRRLAVVAQRAARGRAVAGRRAVASRTLTMAWDGKFLECEHYWGRGERNRAQGTNFLY
jgi:hypothetical protein